MHKLEISRKIVEAIRSHQGSPVQGLYAYADANDQGVMEAGVVLHVGPNNEKAVPFKTFDGVVLLTADNSAYAYEREINDALKDIAGLVLAALSIESTADAR